MAAPVTSPADPPEWERIQEEIRCPLCEYNLRGLTEPRCPECGYRFDWPEILDPNRRLHRYLYEHHPERDFSSLIHTFLGSLRPIRFWKSLHPTQPLNTSRLYSYWRVGVLICVLILTVTAGLIVYLGTRETVLMRAQQRAWLAGAQNQGWRDVLEKQYGSIDISQAVFWPFPTAKTVFGTNIPPSSVSLLALVAAWPWLTALTMFLFRVSMRRARIKMIHVLRCGIYSLTLTVWPCLATTCIFALESAYVSGSYQFLFRFHAYFSYALLGCVLFDLFRLWMAFRLYLRFPHAFATVLASQLIVFLSIANIGFFIQFS